MKINSINMTYNVINMMLNNSLDIGSGGNVYM